MESKMRYKLVLLVLAVSIPASLARGSDNLHASAKAYALKLSIPRTIAEFSPLPHLAPLNQDTTSACWSFATCSFIESEMQRLGRKPVRLAMMYPFFHACVEKARKYVQSEGQSRVAPGDLFTGVLKTARTYGLVPLGAYPGNTSPRQTFNHNALYDELDNLIKEVKALQLWDEELVLQKVRNTLYAHLGAPPQLFDYEAKTYTPQTFLKDAVQLPWDEYALVTSFSSEPFYEFIALDVPDNWAYDSVYFNAPLDVFYSSLQQALKNGYSVALDADISEPGRLDSLDVCIIPPYEIASANINQDARQLRFKNNSTMDDHLTHAVGYRRIKGQDWFLVKDSWRTAWDGKHKGYYFYHGDYVKLKVLAYLVHRDGVPEIKKYLKKSRAKIPTGF
jgi:bleomycin hydrolase